MNGINKLHPFPIARAEPVLIFCLFPRWERFIQSKAHGTLVVSSLAEHPNGVLYLIYHLDVPPMEKLLWEKSGWVLLEFSISILRLFLSRVFNLLRYDLLQLPERTGETIDWTTGECCALHRSLKVIFYSHSNSYSYRAMSWRHEKKGNLCYAL